MNLRTLVASALLSGALALFALPAAASQWVVDSEASTLGFEATVFGSVVPGSFGSWNADIEFDEAALEAASASVTIDMTSVDTGDDTRDSSLKGSEWFATSEFPEASLKSTAFRQTGDGAFEMDADLTMRGTTRSITLPFALSPSGDGVRAQGSVTIDRTEYGVGQGDFVTGATVALEVTISIDVAATVAAE